MLSSQASGSTRFVVAAAFVLASLFAAKSADATSLLGEGPPGPAYRFTLEYDLSAMLISGGVASSFLFLSEGRPAACAPRCDPGSVNFIDRPAAGLYSPYWSKIGDIGAVSTLLFGPLVVVLHERSKSVDDVLVIAEAALITSALQVTVSYAASRPRPRVYGDLAPVDERDDANAARSFFSGHVADTVATTLVAADTFDRLGRSRIGWLVRGVGLGGASLVGVSRVLSGGHFPTDVAVGAAVGTGMGILIPALHASPTRLVPMASEEGGGLLLAGAF